MAYGWSHRNNYAANSLIAQLAGVEQLLNNPRCDRVRATKDAPRCLFNVLERLHGLAEIIERSVAVQVRATS